MIFKTDKLPPLQIVKQCKKMEKLGTIFLFKSLKFKQKMVRGIKACSACLKCILCQMLLCLVSNKTLVKRSF